MSELSIQDLGPKGFTELDYREADGISVALIWSSEDDSLRVVVEDEKVDGAFELLATRENMQDVFQHPYAYAALSSDLVGLLPEFPQSQAA
jgi:hypothetical protein